ncbi:hypothetical protein L1987_12853 [Smallanthus sonchifolius]|uniref:Uncharacterized protein n=1 Tax=Smallanthus sonchifolius TaxID=185202 RepID=A0ACB9JH75_9ASTR|nr:hypothetical protein L1987_12853 [Smallanthus sonchifolius]
MLLNHFREDEFLKHILRSNIHRSCVQLKLGTSLPLPFSGVNVSIPEGVAVSGSLSPITMELGNVVVETLSDLPPVLFFGDHPAPSLGELHVSFGPSSFKPIFQEPACVASPPTQNEGDGSPIKVTPSPLRKVVGEGSSEVVCSSDSDNDPLSDSDDLVPLSDELSDRDEKQDGSSSKEVVLEHDLSGAESEIVRLNSELACVDDHFQKLEEALGTAKKMGVKCVQLAEENGRLQAKVARLSGLNALLGADREWLVTQGFHRVFVRIKRNNEFVRLIGAINSSHYNPIAGQWMEVVIVTYASSGHSLLTHLSNSPDIIVAKIEALSTVVDQNVLEGPYDDNFPSLLFVLLPRWTYGVGPYKSNPPSLYLVFSF